MTTSPGRAPLSATLEEACQRWATRPAITFQGATLTYRQLWSWIVSLACSYERLGINRGDRVLCQLRNCPEHVVAAAAAWQRGAVHVGADNDLTGSELRRLVERLDAAAILFQPRGEDGAADGLAPLDALAGSRARVIVHEGGHAHPYASMAELLRSSDGPVSADLPGPLDPAVLFLTSGTTGEPKAVVETLSAHWAKMQFFADGFVPGPDDMHLLFLPVSHVFGFRLALLALLRGGHLVLLERFSPQRALDLVAREQVSVLPAVPTHLRLLRDRYDPTGTTSAACAGCCPPRRAFRGLSPSGCTESSTPTSCTCSGAARGSRRGPPTATRSSLAPSGRRCSGDRRAPLRTAGCASSTR